ncbi:hypothetical protein G6031_06975 [Dietzia sp. CQ4]|uniref:hypothetical protein n=1 Tax=Dietzia sp. (strain CQ4) TaxID=370437 RepID=UPI0015FD23F4|nr:hypothetical protein [Dietzia sp. CQ4]MBB1034133.1 hypothetical protein [Dietzia sp. CQ4]
MRAFEPLHPRLRIAALTIAAAGSFGCGMACLKPPANPVTYLSTVVPFGAWAAIWIITGAAMLAGIWHRIIARWALAVGASLWFVWGAYLALASVLGLSERGWSHSISMLTLSGVLVVITALADTVGPGGDP